MVRGNKPAGGRGGIERNRGSPSRGAAARAQLHPLPRRDRAESGQPQSRGRGTCSASPRAAASATAARPQVRPVQPPSTGANPVVVPRRSPAEDCCCQSFYSFLGSNPAFEAQLHATKGMNEMHGTSNPYTIVIYYEQMWEFGATDDLIIDTSNSRTDLEIWLLPAVREFVRTFLWYIRTPKENVETIIKGTCLSLRGFPESILLLRDFRKSDALVQRTYLFEGKTYIVEPTTHGRHFMKIFLVGILAKHDRSISWGGNFCEDNIVIIKWRSKSDDGTYTYEMKMPHHKPVEAEGLYDAIVKDLRKATEIFKPLYKDGQDWPVYFVELINTLESVDTQLVQRPRFREFLSNHPALMLSAGRRQFLMDLRDKIYARGIHNLPRYCLSSLTRHADWREIVRTEISARNNVLEAVYNYAGNAPYGNTWHDLINFLRNTCQHVKKQHNDEPELYLAHLFSTVLPTIMWILLQTGDMKPKAIFGDEWLTYKRSR